MHSWEVLGKMWSCPSFSLLQSLPGSLPSSQHFEITLLGHNCFLWLTGGFSLFSLLSPPNEIPGLIAFQWGALFSITIAKVMDSKVFLEYLHPWHSRITYNRICKTTLFSFISVHNTQLWLGKITKQSFNPLVISPYFSVSTLRTLIRKSKPTKCFPTQVSFNYRTALPQ